jgi:hypothetical protein
MEVHATLQRRRSIGATERHRRFRHAVTDQTTMTCAERWSATAPAPVVLTQSASLSPRRIAAFRTPHAPAGERSSVTDTVSWRARAGPRLWGQRGRTFSRAFVSGSGLPIFPPCHDTSGKVRRPPYAPVAGLVRGCPSQAERSRRLDGGLVLDCDAPQEVGAVASSSGVASRYALRGERALAE